MENQVKRTERDDKIKLEDMTLKQIRELKERYKIRVAEALTAIQNEFMEKYDCSFPLFDVRTSYERCYVEDEAYLLVIGNSSLKRDIKIKFSKEDD